MVQATKAAVSVLNRLFPKDMVMEADSISLSEKSPSGPIKIVIFSDVLKFLNGIEEPSFFK